MYFPTTHWSLLAKATSSGDDEARRALEELCRRYWAPVNQFVQFRGHGVTEAQDLTQEFFMHICRHSTFSRADRMRGRFRSFLLGALGKFLANESDRGRAQKRGGGTADLRLDDMDDATTPPAPAEAVAGFDREWATTVLANAMDRVRAEFADGGRREVFGVLKDFLPGAAAPPSYEAAAQRIGLSVPAFRSEVHRLRLRFRALIREEVAATVSAPHEIEQELAHLQSVLMDRGQDLEGA
jgi:DNA-directed RNA polymerase specialized sigma24 family protein